MNWETACLSFGTENTLGELTRPEFTPDRIIEMMVGRKLEELYPEKTAAHGDVVLRVRNMSDKEHVKNAGFELRAGKSWGWRD